MPVPRALANASAELVRCALVPASSRRQLVAADKSGRRTRPTSGSGAVGGFTGATCHQTQHRGRKKEVTHVLSARGPNVSEKVPGPRPLRNAMKGPGPGDAGGWA